MLVMEPQPPSLLRQYLWLDSTNTSYRNLAEEICTLVKKPPVDGEGDAMGRNYSSEMQLLRQTYEWAREVNCDAFATFVKRASRYPLYAIGSGGSNTAAQLAALLHQEMGVPAKALTPLGVLGSAASVRTGAVLLLSASARNWDAEYTARVLCRMEPAELAMLCLRQPDWYHSDDPDFSFLKMIAAPIPLGKDGFLATNSLLAFMILLARAYSDASKVGSLPSTLPQFEHIEAETDGGSVLDQRDELLVLHGKWSLPAAIDLESRCSEAALAHVLTADYRNFAHGRHYWLDQRAERSCVVLLSTPADRDLAEKTAVLLPRSVPTLRLSGETEGPAGAIELVVKSMYLTKVLGDLRGVDPGSPHVPEFGRKLYNMHFRTPYQNVPAPGKARIVAAVSRKTSLFQEGKYDTEYWTDACKRFVHRVSSTEFGAVVLDYDGTLCPEEDRLGGIPKALRSLLLDLLRQGIVLGIATGRGRSVLEELRVFVPPEMRDRVIVGRYNGGEVGLLSEDPGPTSHSPMDDSLTEILAELQRRYMLCRYADIESRTKQISVLPRDSTALCLVENVVLEAVARVNSPGVRAFFSGHSWDVLAAGVTKKSVVAACSHRSESGHRETSVLCIGDQGRWPGNDAELLSTDFSLSVGSCSTDPSTCWNIALPGYRGINATTDYLAAMNALDGKMRFRLTRRKGSLL